MKELQPDPAVAIEFLRAMHPDVPWSLCKISPKGGPPVGEIFEAGQEDQLEQWQKKNEKDGLYFHVNRVRDGVRGKAKKSDIVEVRHLHVDLDPRAGEDLEQEQARMLAALEAYDPPPSAIVFSGSGYHAYWELDEPADPEVAEACNLALAQDLGGDDCHNIDRLMRLPGTVNWPNAKKIKKGRKPALVTLVRAFNGTVYPLPVFPAAEATNGAATVGEIVIPEGLQPVALDDLPDAVSDSVKGMIVQGPDRDKHPSRSEALFAVCCKLVRAGCDDGEIYSVIMNPNYGISASVLDKGGAADRYAKRQIGRARAVVETDWRETTKSGDPIKSYSNTRVAIQRLGVETDYDAFHDRLILGGNVLQQWVGPITDNACAMLRQYILEKFGFDPGSQNIHDAVQQLCLEHRFDPVLDYLAGLVWNGKARLDTWLNEYMGADDTPLIRAFARKMLIAAVRRVRQPGCKFDQIVVLEGPQGSGKSTALCILASDENFSDQDILAYGAREQQEAVAGVWIYEICELEGLSKAEVNRVKAFASRTTDRARAAYARHSEGRPRRCIFVGTTNEDTYLRDATGNRRFWPVRTGRIDLDALGRDRDQLWAEAAAREAEGESIVLSEHLWADATAAQNARMEVDPWEDKLAQTLDGKNRVHSRWLLDNVLAIPAAQQRGGVAKRLAACMRRLGWEGPKPVRIGGVPGKGYERRVTVAQGDMEARQGALDSQEPF